MALTVLMFVVLIVSYALMFGLVQFSDNVIATPESGSAGESGAAMQTHESAPPP